jgi:hypothetical protein
MRLRSLATMVAGATLLALATAAPSWAQDKIRIG